MAIKHFAWADCECIARWAIRTGGLNLLEEELTEKNSIDAELLTLRSEFEKSSATYDREIDGLKDMLEKVAA